MDHRRENIRGSVLMVLAMAGFALEDMFVKHLSGHLPLGQLLAMLGIGGTLIFGVLARARGGRVISRDFWARPVLLRNLAELAGTVCFVSAIALTPLAQASAILQATPLAVTLGAAVFLGEKVGWRRWSAILVGFAGVLIVIRPGTSGFSVLSLLAVGAVLGLAARDLATRRVGAGVSSLQLGAWGFASVIPAGLAMVALGPGAFTPMSAVDYAQIAAALVFGTAAYYALIAAMRIGEVSVITPFRYTRLIFALGIG
ncbi:MAG: DMT family transporter, partial [Sphingomonadales bacterium]|nr:DMT family transporter [Sphingomonadales bacterium]